MRLLGTLTFIIGVLLILVAAANPVLEPLGCPGVGFLIVGLATVLSAIPIRRMPKNPADHSVKCAFEAVANDPRFRVVANLEEDELDMLANDLAAAIYRQSRAGWAGRNKSDEIVLAASSSTWQRASVAHELFHLVRDVIHRSRGNNEGCDLRNESRVFREELFVWYQTIQYAPIRAPVVEIGPFVVLAAILLVGSYVLSSRVC
jgi:hypothetical protein